MSLWPVNTHIHLPPNFSAFATWRESVSQAQAEGLRALGASNYYDFRVYEPWSRACREAGIAPIAGLEILTDLPSAREAGQRVNDPVNPGKAYLCGKAITQTEGGELLTRIREGDESRVREMVFKLDELSDRRGFATHLTYESIAQDVADRAGVPREAVVLQERHVAEAFQTRLFELGGPEALATVCGIEPETDPVKAQGALRTAVLKAGRPAFVPERFVTFREGLRLVAELGGIASYPVLADGANPVCEFESDPIALARDLEAMGVFAAEFIPPRNAPDVLGRYVSEFVRRGFVVTAGTEHNTSDPAPLEPKCKGGSPLPESCRQAFAQGAAVLVAHCSGQSYEPAPRASERIERIRELAGSVA